MNYLGNPPQPVDPVDPDPTDPEDPSPVDPAPRSYTLTVYYYDVETGDEVNGSYTEKHSYGDSYTVTVPEIEGYTYDHSVGATSGKITRDEIIMIYYMADVDLPDE